MYAHCQCVKSTIPMALCSCIVKSDLMKISAECWWRILKVETLVVLLLLRLNLKTQLPFPTLWSCTYYDYAFQKYLNISIPNAYDCTTAKIVKNNRRVSYNIITAHTTAQRTSLPQIKSNHDISLSHVMYFMNCVHKYLHATTITENSTPAKRMWI